MQPMTTILLNASLPCRQYYEDQFGETTEYYYIILYKLYRKANQKENRDFTVNYNSRGIYFIN
jgi:hypothetical protein